MRNDDSTRIAHPLTKYYARQRTGFAKPFCLLRPTLCCRRHCFDPLLIAAIGVVPRRPPRRDVLSALHPPPRAVVAVKAAIEMQCEEGVYGGAARRRQVFPC
ncbi:hypothetical protein Aduo_005559 [Ancylostoma duodenale]